MIRAYKTDLLITGYVRGGVRAVQMTVKERERLGAAGMKIGEKLKIGAGPLERFAERGG